MKQRFFVLTVLSVVAVSASLAGQTPARWTAPKTADGQPDLQGVWDFRTVTPMDRRAEFKDKATLTEQEVAEYEKRIVASRNVDERRDKTVRRQVNGTDETQDVASAYNEFWWDRGTKVIGTRRT